MYPGLRSSGTSAWEYGEENATRICFKERTLCYDHGKRKLHWNSRCARDTFWGVSQHIWDRFKKGSNIRTATCGCWAWQWLGDRPNTRQASMAATHGKVLLPQPESLRANYSGFDRQNTMQTQSRFRQRQDQNVFSANVDLLSSPICFDPERRGDPLLTNDEILKIWRTLTKGLIEINKRKEIEKAVLGLEK